MVALRPEGCRVTMKKSDPKGRSNLPARSSYEVGYGKPPKETRFGPGVSGNPRGRPKGSRNKPKSLGHERLKEIVLEEAYRTVQVRDGDAQVSVPIAQAVIRTLGVKAAKGDHRSQRLFAELLSSVESANRRLHDEYLETAIVYKAEWERELFRRDRLGITDLPDPLPHPDHIEINMSTGQVIMKGPMTKEEKAKLDWLIERKAAFEEDLAYCRDTLAKETDPKCRTSIEDDIAHTQRILTIIERMSPAKPRPVSPE